jgi:hypothetical protein
MKFVIKLFSVIFFYCFRNILSAVIDLSHIYGNDEYTKKLLREFSGGNSF